MEHNHMLVRDGDSMSDTEDAVALGPGPGPAPAPPTELMNISPPSYSKATFSDTNKFAADATAATIRFPQVPTNLPLAKPPTTTSAHGEKNEIRLPSLSSITGGPLPAPGLVLNQPHGQWYTVNHLPMHPASQQAQSADSPLRMDLDTSSNSVVSAASPDRIRDARSTSVNLDDPNVRLAVEALEDLRTDCIASPPNMNNSLPVSPPRQGFQSVNSGRPRSPRTEPLLSLLTTTHPLLASTIESATSAYGGAKNFSPRFRSGAEYVEGYLTPIANTVGSVGRVAGVEGGVRWFLGAGRRQGSSSSDLETGGNSKKRRKVASEAELASNKRLEAEGMQHVDVQQLPTEAGYQDGASKAGSRRMSMTSTTETLPAYDDIRSPAYTETVDGQQSSRSTPSNAPWQSRLIMSTSGLSVAMSEESLRSLKYCLRWLRWANEHIGRVINALKDALEQYDRAENATLSEQEQLTNGMNGIHPTQRHESRSEIAARITTLKGDVLRTLQKVIDTVSKYAGGALPENARVLVRRHLTSLPQRFRMATMAENNSLANDQDSDSALREGAHKVLILAKESLDMVAQVSGVVDGTIVSAEEWCDRMGKKRDKTEPEKPILPQTQFEANGDVKMG